MLYFVYELVNSLSALPGYVGITNNPNMRHKQHMGMDSNKRKSTWMQKTIDEGAEVKMNILQVVDDEPLAREREKYWINFYTSQGVLLTNIQHNEGKLTRYDGEVFFTALEAQWAVFFKHINVPYTYRTKGYKIDGEWHIPSFWIPDKNYWIHVNEQEPTENETKKHVALTTKLEEVEDDKDPDPWKRYTVYSFVGAIPSPPHRSLNATEYELHREITTSNWGEWIQCPHCGEFWMSSIGELALPCYCFNMKEFSDPGNKLDTYMGKDAAMKKWWMEKMWSILEFHDTPDLIEAYTAARQARF